MPNIEATAEALYNTYGHIDNVIFAADLAAQALGLDDDESPEAEAVVAEWAAISR